MNPLGWIDTCPGTISLVQFYAAAEDLFAFFSGSANVRHRFAAPAGGIQRALQAAKW
jgi:hypothetical protein